ncbi:MAG: PAS domain S-box protein, partial [Rhodanobacteraceae bacterium]
MAFRIVNLADEATGRALHAAADQAAGDIELSIEAADADVLVCTVSDSRTLAAVTDARRHSPDAQIVLRVPDDEADRVRARVSFVPGMAGAWVVPASSTPAALADVLRKAASISVRRRRVRALRKHINQQLARNGEADAHGAECPREQQLERSASYLPTLFAQAPQAFVAITPEGDVTAWNQAAERICGVSAHAAVGRPIAQVLPPAAAQALLELAQRTIGHDAVSAQEMKLALAPATIWAQVNATPVRSGEDLLCVSVTIRDVSERHAMIGRVRASELRYRTLTETLPQLIWTTDRDGNAVYYNRQWLEYTGAEAASHAGHGWLDAVHPDDRALAAAAWRGAVAGEHPYDVEYRLRGADGSYRWFKARGTPIRDEEGRVTEWFGTTTDIDDLVRAREVLKRDAAELEATVERETRRRTAAEAVLHRVGKMEAIGNLTGGIAHDFNNILQVIGGNLQLLAAQSHGDAAAAQRITNALESVKQGSRLASQLLAFGRRQPLSPKVVNVGRLVREMDDMLRRSLGERVELETIIAGGLWNTLVDRSNIESALLNLAINARDAMHGEGELTIEVGNAFLDQDYADANPEVDAGQYVVLAITDTGCGMSPELADKVFEPFFTTKPEGKGTGLGLSIVYGFVKQSAGHIKIYSEVGHGTTFRVYLPRSRDAEDLPVSEETRPVHGGTETVLVVEDDDTVRDLAVATLSDLGYAVLKARDAEAALAIIESGAPVDLLFTDVVMPGPLKSPELARKARERLPHLAVLYTSGYTQNAIVHSGRLEADVELLSKPYSREALARKLRHVLANRATAAGTEAPRAGRQPPANGSPCVLLCDDEPMIREAFGELLKRKGYHTLLAATGAEALELARDNRIDVLVTDVHLPDISGMDLARQILQAVPECPVLFATGDRRSSPADLADARFIFKPFGVDELCRAIAATLSVRGGDDGAASTGVP